MFSGHIRREYVDAYAVARLRFALGDVDDARAHARAMQTSARMLRYAEQLGLDVERFMDDLREHAGAARIADDVDSADLSGVSGTPTFFINGRRHYGAYDIATLSAAVRAAGARATLTTA